MQAAAGSAAAAAAVAPADDERETADGGGNPPPPSSPPARVAVRPPPPPPVPVVTLASTAPFSLAAAIGSLPAAAGVASMGLPAGAVTCATGFYTDGLVAAADARVPGADWVVLGGLYHSAPALDVVGEVPGRRPGVLTAALLGLLLDRVEARERESAGMAAGPCVARILVTDPFPGGGRGGPPLLGWRRVPLPPSCWPPARVFTGATVF